MHGSQLGGKEKSRIVQRSTQPHNMMLRKSQVTKEKSRKYDATQITTCDATQMTTAPSWVKTSAATWMGLPRTKIGGGLD